MTKTKNINGYRYSVLQVIAAAAISLLLASRAHAAILFQNDDFGEINSTSLILNNDNESSGDLTLQFGQSLGEYLKWNSTTTGFEFSDDLDLTNNQLTTARVENLAALPGGAGGLGAGGKGRIVQLTVIDSIAPGCTGPSCAVGTYSWDGSTWHSLQGSITTSNATKIVTVGPSGRDYTTISAAATYCNTLSGCEMWIDPGSYPVTTSVDLENTKLRGSDTALTTVALTVGGKLLVRNSKFETITINIDSAITAAMGLDVQYSASSSSALEFSQVNFIVGGAKIGIDSTAGTPPVTIGTFNQCTESSGTGTLLKTVATANLSGSSAFTVINLLSSSPLKIVDWPITIIGGSNVVTSGTITTVPDRTILVSPGMNIQSAITSLGASGGVVKLLIGTHDITNELSIIQDNIEIVGEGPGTILRAVSGTWVGGTTNNNCVIQVGLANGTAPRTNVIVGNFKVQVGPNVHGVCINGGTEDKVIDMYVQSIGVKSGTRTGIVFTDGSTTAGSRFTSSRNIINDDVAANRWVDGVHYDGDADLAGQTFGYGNGITDSIISETIVFEAAETSYAFDQVSASSVFSNRARNIGTSAAALGMFFYDNQDTMIINNTMEGAAAAATGIDLNTNDDNMVVIGNAVRGGPTNYSVGIRVNSATSTGVIVSDNQFNAVTTTLTDNGTSTKLETDHHRATVNPAATDDIADGFGVGTVWINTSTAAVFVSTDSTAGAAVWTSLTGGSSSGTTANTFTLDTDNTGGNVTLQFGAALAETLTWNNAASRFDLSDDLNLSGGLTLPAGTGTAAPILKHLSVTAAAVTSASIAAITCGTYATITVTGATVGDTVIATPTAIAGGIETVSLGWSSTVSAANTVIIRACNPTALAINTANTQTWRIDVWGH